MPNHADCLPPARSGRPRAAPPPWLEALSPGLPHPLDPCPEPLPEALLCPLAGEAVAAGFPSPADDYVEARIDLNLELIPRPLSTFLMRASGDALRGDGILDGDLLVIDRSVTPRPGQVVVATHQGGFILRRLGRREGRLWLEASDGVSPPIPLGPERDPADPPTETELWGVALHAIHHLGGEPGRRR
ncbi:MAG: LexA family protein [Synechococcaceae cyanobacterium]